jgi:hypothetical protein
MNSRFYCLLRKVQFFKTTMLKFTIKKRVKINTFFYLFNKLLFIKQQHLKSVASINDKIKMIELSV